MKPDYFSHPEIVALSIPARLLLLSLLTQADDEGRLYDQPTRIRGLAFGEGDRVKVPRLLDELAESGRIERYEAFGRRCIQVVNFDRHQRVNRPTRSVIPHGGLTEPSRLEVEVEGKGKEEERKEQPLERAPRARDPLFDALAESEGSDPREVTRRAARTIGVALAEIRNATPDVTPVEITRRAALWPQHFPDATFTASALAKHWARLSRVALPRPTKDRLALAAERIAREAKES